MKLLNGYVPHPCVPAVHVSSRETESHDLPAVVAQQVNLEAVASSCRTPAVCRDVFGHLVGTPPSIVSDGYHGVVHKAEARAFPERPNPHGRNHVERHTRHKP